MKLTLSYVILSAIYKNIYNIKFLHISLNICMNTYINIRSNCFHPHQMCIGEAIHMSVVAYTQWRLWLIAHNGHADHTHDEFQRAHMRLSKRNACSEGIKHYTL